MRTLNSGMATQVASTYTDPGFLIAIQISASVTLRYSTRGQIDWNGSIYIPVGADPPSYQTNTSGVQQGSLKFQNLTQSLITAILQYGIADKPVSIWAFDAGALDAADPVLDFYGVGDSVQWDEKKMTIKIVSQSSRVQFSPRLLISKENGFSQLPAPGMTFVWNNELYELQ